MYISRDRENKLLDFQEKYNLNFKNLSLLNQAFIHTSYTNENNLDIKNSYERLEFLGDAVLKLIISDIFYNKFKNHNEGELTKLRSEVVSDNYIFEFAKKMDFQNLILLGQNEKKSGGAYKKSILACAFEALLGAIFLNYEDIGYKKAYFFLYDNFLDDILNINNKTTQKLSPKSTLQEYTQALNHKLPLYRIIKEEGAEHNKIFHVEVSFNNKVLGTAKAKSIKEAQQKAALEALYALKIIEKEEG